MTAEVAQGSLPSAALRPVGAAALPAFRQGGCRGAGMDQGNQTRDDAEPGFSSWLGFWAQFLVLGLLAVIGANFASTDGRPGDYACGLLLSLSAVALGFLRLKHRLDGGVADWAAFLLVDDMKNLALTIPLFAVLGLAGLFVAHAWEGGALHIAGLGLFVASGAIVFLDIKHVFDRISSDAS
jgi:hypothetical protein